MRERERERKKITREREINRRNIEIHVGNVKDLLEAEAAQLSYCLLLCRPLIHSLVQVKSSTTPGAINSGSD